MRKCEWCGLILIMTAMPAFGGVWTVSIAEDGFFPQVSTIPVGDTVFFFPNFEDPSAHNVVADDGSFRCARGCDGEGGDGTPAIQWRFQRTFNAPGLVRFHDEVSGAGGLIVVSPGAIGDVVEFFNPDLGHYFITADPSEQAYVDTGAVGHWQRTGQSFKSGGPSKVCRFRGGAWGPNSHFYTVDPDECSALKAAPWSNGTARWIFEGNDFTASPAAQGRCPAGLAPVYRAYNNGFAQGIDSNHRITASSAAYEATVANGWIGEGVAMCAPQ